MKGWFSGLLEVVKRDSTILVGGLLLTGPEVVENFPAVDGSVSGGDAVPFLDIADALGVSIEVGSIARTNMCANIGGHKIRIAGKSDFWVSFRAGFVARFGLNVWVYFLSAPLEVVETDRLLAFVFDGTSVCAAAKIPPSVSGICRGNFKATFDTISPHIKHSLYYSRASSKWIRAKENSST